MTAGTGILGAVLSALYDSSERSIVMVLRDVLPVAVKQEEDSNPVRTNPVMAIESAAMRASNFEGEATLRKVKHPVQIMNSMFARLLIRKRRALSPRTPARVRGSRPIPGIRTAGILSERLVHDGASGFITTVFEACHVNLGARGNTCINVINASIGRASWYILATI